MNEKKPLSSRAYAEIKRDIGDSWFVTVTNSGELWLELGDSLEESETIFDSMTWEEAKRLRDFLNFAFPKECK